MLWRKFSSATCPRSASITSSWTSYSSKRWRSFRRPVNSNRRILRTFRCFSFWCGWYPSRCSRTSPSCWISFWDWSRIFWKTSTRSNRRGRASSFSGKKKGPRRRKPSEPRKSRSRRRSNSSNRSSSRKMSNSKYRDRIARWPRTRPAPTSWCGRRTHYRRHNSSNLNNSSSNNSIPNHSKHSHSSRSRNNRIKSL